MICIETQTRVDVEAVAKGVGGGSGALVKCDLFEMEWYSWTLPHKLQVGSATWEKLKLPKFLHTTRAYLLLLISVITTLLLSIPTFKDEAQQRCLALLVCVTILWATEAIPLFVTGMLCPLLVVLFQVVKKDNGELMNAMDASAFILGKMWSSAVMVLISGFTLAGGLSKFNITKVLASYMLSVAGTSPRNVLLAIMSVSLLLSLCISNVATPILCYSLLQGILKTQMTNSPFSKALVLGVALASNIGGMASPIASPQNIVAMEYLVPYGIGWSKWLAVSIPVTTVSLIAVWLLLIMTFKMKSDGVLQYTPHRECLTAKQWFVAIVTVATVVLWCVLSQVEDVFGEAGQVGVIPIVLFFGTGILSTVDVNNFPWSMVLLAMGSLALGKAISSSGLLATISTSLQVHVLEFHLYIVVLIFGVLMLVVGTFVSHTVSAIILIPLVQEIGELMPGEDGKPAMILIFISVLIASCGMGLGSSGFPNSTAISLADEFGHRYLTSRIFITRGIPASILATLVVLTLGYGIMMAI